MKLRLHIVLAVLAFSAAACAAEIPVRDTQAACLRDGGTWGPQGMQGIPGCVRPMADAGKACQTGNDCLAKKCLTAKGNKEHGLCAGTDQVFGCFDLFENGQVSGLCVD
jgi:hypothetical protein